MEKQLIYILSPRWQFIVLLVVFPMSDYVNAAFSPIVATRCLNIFHLNLFFLAFCFFFFLKNTLYFASLILRSTDLNSFRGRHFYAIKKYLLNFILKLYMCDSKHFSFLHGFLC